MPSTAGGDRDRADRDRLRLELRKGQEGGTSFGITPFTYCSRASALTTFSERLVFARHRLQGAAVGAVAGDLDLAVAGGAQPVAAAGQQLAAGAAQTTVPPCGGPRSCAAGRAGPAGTGGAAESDVAGGGAEQDADLPRLGHGAEWSPV